MNERRLGESSVKGKCKHKIFLAPQLNVYNGKTAFCFLHVLSFMARQASQHKQAILRERVYEEAQKGSSWSYNNKNFLVSRSYFCLFVDAEIVYRLPITVYIAKMAQIYVVELARSCLYICTSQPGIHTTHMHVYRHTHVLTLYSFCSVQTPL